MEQPEGAYADPVPQSLILTAIVISFGVLAFTQVLAYRAYQTVGSDDLDDMQATDQLTPPAGAVKLETVPGDPGLARSDPPAEAGARSPAR